MAKIQKYWSPGTGGFYSSEVHGDDVPADAVKISDDHYSRLIRSCAMGASIEMGNNGQPIPVERVPDVPARMASARARRNAALAATDWLILRHREEPFGGTTLSEEQLRALLMYRAQLRDWPRQLGFPDSPMPKNPL